MSVKVSISVTTYNQAKYIEQTLESLLMQKTDFKFEILINDDASTDASPDIIKRYEETYPDIIKPIYQTVNQYTQGKEVHYTFNYTRAKGKYIAYCDGDDYWTDPLKLQKQFNFMESHADVSACVHAGKAVNEKGTRILWTQRADYENSYLNTAKVISSQGMFASNSLFMRNYFSEEYKVPDWFHEAKITDYPLYLILSTKGDLYYMDDIMCSFRVASKGSFTQVVLNDPDKKKTHLYEMIDLLESFNKETHSLYEKIIIQQINHNLFDYVSTDITVIKTNPEEFRELYNTVPLKVRMKLNARYYVPGAVNVYKKMKEPIVMFFKPKETFYSKI
ncbi:MAG: glycosyltransferase [Alkalibacterium sp.]|nr:glycosyltransferase [Alkalibacterium sp.]